MNAEIERLWKLKDRIDRRKFHLHIETNMMDMYRWALYLYMPNIDDYLSSWNRAILTSEKSTLNELEVYLMNYDGFDKRW